MPTSEKTILVVDDDPPIRVMIEALLSDSGFSIVTVPDGATALARIEADPPDVLILDYAMPRMSGREVLRELRARNSRLPVIVLSASPYAQNCLAEGANFLVQKPFDLEVLLLCIERCLAHIRAVRPVHMALYFALGDMPQREVLRSIERFAGEVIPGIEKELGPLQTLA